MIAYFQTEAGEVPIKGPSNEIRLMRSRFGWPIKRLIVYHVFDPCDECRALGYMPCNECECNQSIVEAQQ